MSVIEGPELAPELAAPAAGPLRRRGGPVARLHLTPGHLLPVVLAVVAALLVMTALKDRAAMETVGVAAVDIPAGAHVGAGDVRWVRVHRSDGAVVAGMLSMGAPQLGWTARVAIPAGAPIAVDELVGNGSSSSGLGAMSLQLPPADADGGALEPGDRVDVIGMTGGSAAYVATGVEVLAVADPSRSGALAQVQGSGYYVTLAVDPSTALKLAAAMAGQTPGGSSPLELVRTTGESQGGQ